MLVSPESLDAELLQQEKAGGKPEAEETRPGLTIFTDGQRLDDGVSGMEKWAILGGHQIHMGYNQGAHDGACAALARALETAVRRLTTSEWVTIFTDAQAAIRRATSEQPGWPLQVKEHIARPDVTIEIR